MDWYDCVSVIGGSFEAACIVALAVSAVVYFGLRLLHAIPRLRRQHTWRTAFFPLRWVGPIAFALVLFPGVLIGWVTSDLCGTSQSEEFRSPDGKQKIVVYAFDCGATTDFSLVVSLLGAHDRLPKHRMAPALYSHYHQEPSGSNIEVIWQDSHDAIVKVEAFDGAPLKKQDDVSIRFERPR